MLKNNLKNLLKLLLVLGISSCSVAPPNVPICSEINATKGYCVEIVSSKDFVVTEENKFNDKTWWEMRPYMVYLPHDSWAEIKKFIIKVCKKYNCDGVDVSNWERTIEAIDSGLSD